MTVVNLNYKYIRIQSTAHLLSLRMIFMLTTSAAEFRKYCKRLHIDMYTKPKRLHAKYSIVHIVYLPFDNVWCLTAMGKNNER